MSNPNPSVDSEYNGPSIASFAQRVQAAERLLVEPNSLSSGSLPAALIQAQKLSLEGAALGGLLSVSDRLALDRLEQAANEIVLENDEDLSVLSEYLAANPIPEPLLLFPFSDCLSSSDYELLAVANPEKQALIVSTSSQIQIVALNEYGEGTLKSESLEACTKEFDSAPLSIKRLEDSPDHLSILFSGRLSSAIRQVRLGTVYAQKSPTEQGIWRADFSAFLPSARRVLQQALISVWLEGTEPLERLTVLPPLLSRKQQAIEDAFVSEESSETKKSADEWDAICGRNQYSWLSALRYPESYQNDCRPVIFCSQNDETFAGALQAIPQWIAEPIGQKERILQIRFVGLNRQTVSKVYCHFFGRIQAITADHPILCLSETQFEAISDYRQASFQVGLQPTGPFVSWGFVESTGETYNQSTDETPGKSTDDSASDTTVDPAGLSNVWLENAFPDKAAAHSIRKTPNLDDWFFQPTPEQQETLDCMGAIPRLLVKGSAGTGKTMLGFYQAQQFALSGKSTLFMCFNRNLAQWLARRVPDELKDRLTVRNFHALCYDYATRAGLEFKPTETGSGEDFWQNQAPKLLLQSLADPNSPRFDAIILDEAQDFRCNWLHSLDMLLTSSRAPLYLFCDPRQNLFQNQSQDRTLDMLRDWLFANRTVNLECSLVQNCRNVRNIARYSGRVIGQDLKSKAGMKEGPEVYVCQTADAAENRFMANWIVQSQLDRSVRPAQMAILSHRTLKNSSLGGIERIADVPITEDLEQWQSNGGILYSSIRRFKGLEADNILLLDVGPYDSCADHGFSCEELYTGCTRARQSLSVLACPDVDALVLA